MMRRYHQPHHTPNNIRDVNEMFPPALLAALLIAWSLCLSVVGVLLSSTTIISGVEAARAKVPLCVNDAVAPAILMNRSMSYADKVALYYSNPDAYDSYRSIVARNASAGLSPLNLCPQLRSVNAFAPEELWRFHFLYSRKRDVINATAEGVQCGIDCRRWTDGAGWSSLGVLHGEPIARLNVTTENGEIVPGIVPHSVVECGLYSPNTTALDSVCTAFIRYNSTFWENGTVYALPTVVSATSNPAILDPSTVTISVGKDSPLTLWLPPSLTFCPWYYNAGAVSSRRSAVNVTSDDYLQYRATPAVLLELSYRTPDMNYTMEIPMSFPLVGASCEVASPHPVSGSMGVRYRGVVSSQLVDQHIYQTLLPLDIFTEYNVTVAGFVAAYFMPPFYVASAGANESLFSAMIPFAEVEFLRPIVPSLSPWWPTQNYSLPEPQNVPTRCYASSPVAIDNSSTILSRDTLSCATGNVPMIVDIKSDTSFCCSAPNASSSFVWPGFIYVNDVGTRWFTDTAGIVATPTPTRATLAPPGATTSPVSSGSHEDHASQEGGDSSSSSGGPDGQSPSSGEDTALIFGISILGISAVVVVMVLAYFKWWKPRQESGGSTMQDHRKNYNELDEHLMRSSSVTIDGLSGPAADARNFKLLDAMDSDVELL